MAVSDKELSPIALKVLKFSVDREGVDGLRYEDYMEGLSSVLSGITISQLSIALHQLETKGFLHPDPHGTPNRKIRVTPMGRQLSGSQGGIPETPAAPAPRAAEPVPVPVQEARPAPSPAPTEVPQTAVEVQPASPIVARQEAPSTESSNPSGADSAQEIRRRLREVIAREEDLKTKEEKTRRKETELLNEEERLSGMQKSFEERRRKLDEDEKQVAVLEDTLHEHLTNLKGHLANMNQVTQNVHQLHEKVTASRQKRRKV